MAEKKVRRGPRLRMTGQRRGTYLVELRALRKELGVSQMRLAAVLGVCGQTLSAWEKGKSCPVGIIRKARAFLERTKAAGEYSVHELVKYGSTKRDKLFYEGKGNSPHGSGRLSQGKVLEFIVGGSKRSREQLRASQCYRCPNCREPVPLPKRVMSYRAKSKAFDDHVRSCRG